MIINTCTRDHSGHTHSISIIIIIISFSGNITFTQFCGIMRREHPSTLNDLVTLFKKIDKNKDGLISANDLIKLLTKVRVRYNL